MYTGQQKAKQETKKRTECARGKRDLSQVTAGRQKHDSSILKFHGRCLYSATFFVKHQEVDGHLRVINCRLRAVDP
jgi:hypothetical protein